MVQYLVANLQAHPSLQEKVYDHLRQAILAGEIEPGQRLLETKLAQSLGVSRIPVREAIRKLEREGLIVVYPRRGVYASSLTPKDVDETYRVRAVLEGLAARQAAESRTEEHVARLDGVLAVMAQQVEAGDAAGLFATGRQFHEIVLEAAANDKLTALMLVIRGHVERIRQVRMRVGRRTHDVLAEYRRIRDAIERRDGATAEAEMRAHVEYPREALLEMMRAGQVSAADPQTA
ncbi:MAG TPA: GntR family transcriptional regulator [Chloroflexota bacterium]|nr:GntR family transcriptional regulator [Chloroflexota bacterium]